jgi:DNA polymerase II large subunit
VVSSPIEGFTGLKLGKTRDGKDYFKAYFSGPIRSAGTTASCVCFDVNRLFTRGFRVCKI